MINEAKNVNFLPEFARGEAEPQPAPVTHSLSLRPTAASPSSQSAKCQSVSPSLFQFVTQSVQLSIKYSLIKAKYI